MTARRGLPSLLPRPLRAFLAVIGGLAILVFADTLYLVTVRLLGLLGLEMAGSGAASSQFFQVALLGHSVLGTLFVSLIALFVALHLPKVWRRRHAAAIGSGLLTLVVCVGLLWTGLFVLSEAATRQHRWVWWLHVSGAIALPLLYVAHRRSGVVRVRTARARRFAQAVVGLTLALGVGHAVVGQADPPPVAAENLPPAAAELARERYGVVPPGFASPLSPFYPSPATTSVGGRVDAAAVLGPAPAAPTGVREPVRTRGFYAGEGIGAEGCVRCHADVVRQWEASAHRFSSFNNPFYEASLVRLRSEADRRNPWLDAHRERTGTAAGDGILKSRWCGACHDPALLFTGRLDEPVDRASVAAQAGLTCLACHGIRTLHDRTGNGNYVLRASTPAPYVFSDATEPGVRRRVHDAALRARPEAHRASMMAEVLRTPEFCGSCHKVSLREPVNDYRWLRGQNEFDRWENSGVSREGAQTFYLPENRRTCQDCHMPPEPAPLGDVAAVAGQVRSHRFLAANTALPFIRGDTAALRRVEAFLQDEIVTVDLFGARTADGRHAERALGDRLGVAPGAEIELDVVVRNRGVGHSFPGGTLDSNEGWLDVRLLDEAGAVVARSGDLDEAGHLDPGAHVYRALFVDSAGNEIDRRNPQDIRSLVFANAIGPGEARLAHYRMTVPERPGRYTLDVRLQWRKFSRHYSEFVFDELPEAFPGHAEAPRLPITTLADARLTLHVDGGALTPRTGPNAAAGGGGAIGPGDPEAWERWNDFGIASLREGRTRTAGEAFSRVAALAPGRPDGPLNLARVALEEGDVAAALVHLEDAGHRAPNDARVSWLRGEALLGDGDYGAAATAYRRVLASFPRHRASLLGLGRALYLDGRLEEALEPLDGLLALDPEARPAWYHRMLILRALGRAGAGEAEAMVEYLRVDESAGRLTRRIRAENPGVNTMAQDVRIHVLRPVTP